MTSRRAAVALGVAIAACGKDDRAATKRPAVMIDVAAVNALVPPALRAALVFEQRALVIERGQHTTTYTMAAPRGWPQTSTRFAHLQGDPGTVTRLEVGSSCDGECTPRPWAAVADRVNFAPRAKGKVRKDDQGPARRTMIADVERGGARTTDVVTAWWTDGASRYHTCIAWLGAALQDAAPAFERACQTVAIDGAD